MSSFASTWSDLRWLTSAASIPYLELASDFALSELQRAERLRRELSTRRARLVLEQAALRQRASDKFSVARRMFFAPVALEQATDEQIARYKARRFTGDLVLDLCCGIGGDLVALAERGAVLGAELDPARAWLAAANLRVGASPDSSSGGNAAPACERLVVCGDASRLRLPPDACWHIDPDRRVEGRRTVDVQHYAPRLEILQRMLAEGPHAAIKLAPAASVPDDWRAACELEWISRGGECRQQVVWCGRLATAPGSRRATRIDSSGNSSSIVGRADAPADVALALGRYLHEPDPAVLAARLIGALAAELRLQPIDADAVYLTSDEPARHPLAASFAIEEVLPLDLRKLRQHLHARGIGRLEIKKRGVEHDPAAVRRQLALRGERAATLVLTRLAGQRIAIVALRVATEPA
ncbi:MAG: hypothetical protein AB7U73_17345 [Pirellulales bacterium]